MRYTIAIADTLDSLCDAKDAAIKAIDESFLDDAACKRWREKITSAWQMILEETDGSPREYLDLAILPNNRTVLLLESRTSERPLTYQVTAKQCACKGARHVCDHRVAAQLVTRALWGNEHYQERAA